MTEGNTNKNQGEGNREADKRYREGVRKTVDRLDLDKDDARDDKGSRADEKS